MRKNLMSKILVAVFLVTTFVSKESALASVTEDVLVRRDDSVDAHNKHVGAELARERTKAQLSQAKLEYDMNLRLGQNNTASKWEIYEKLVNLLNAQIADRVAEHMVNVSGIDQQIGELRRSWREGSSPVDVPALARLMVAKRESSLVLAEGSMADFRQIADARKAMYEIQDDLAQRRVVSEVDRHLAMVLKNQALAEATIWASELEVAKSHLAQAKKDLEAVGGL